MKNLFKYRSLLAYSCLLLSSCGEFTNPTHEGFLDWNQNYLSKKNQEKIEKGYVFHGSTEEAGRIGKLCAKKYKNYSKLHEECLIENGFNKVSSE